MGGQIVDAFGGWTFQETLPGIWAYATQAYEAMGPLVWLVGGIILGSIVIHSIIEIIRAAVGQAD